MKPRFVKQKFALLFIFLLGSAFTAKAGLDSYEIYLNDKLLIKQYVNQPLSLEALPLTQANINDRLVINYSQCNMPNKLGKGRSILVKDAGGRVLKHWKFADAKSGRSSMVIPVKDLLALDKKASRNELALFYAAEGRTEGQLLAHLRLGTKPITHQRKQLIPAGDIALWAYFPLLSVFIYKS